MALAPRTRRIDGHRHGLVGIGGTQLSAVEMCLRALVVFPLAVVFVRVGDRRFLGELSALDLVVGIMLGSVLSRAITGNAPFVATLAAGLALVLLHRVFARIASGSDRLGRLVKGREQLLVQGGQLLEGPMRRAGIGEHDLRGAVRRKAGIVDLGLVDAAYLERTGDISVVRRDEPTSRDDHADDESDE